MKLNKNGNLAPFSLLMQDPAPDATVVGQEEEPQSVSNFTSPSMENLSNDNW
jgi:hypothetical protein